MKKHAYLIMAHTNFNQLQSLINTIDDSRNDIFIHIDKKCTLDSSKLSSKYSKLYFTKRNNVIWGGYSQIDTELVLLKKAFSVSPDYNRFHLLSGLDLPIKSQDYIHSFFENNNQEYIDYDMNDQYFDDRCKYYYTFQDIVGRDNRNALIKQLRRIQNLLVKLQTKFKIIRHTNMTLYKGANWFSITNGMAKYILDNEKNIKKIFGMTLCCDELFLQTFAKISPFSNNINQINLRLIDWNRGKPYTFKAEDYNELLNSDCLFARKFDETIDSKIIDLIIAKVGCLS